MLEGWPVRVYLATYGLVVYVHLFHMVRLIEEGDEHRVQLLLHYVHQILEGYLNVVGEQLLGIVADLTQVRVLFEEVEQLAGVGQPIGQHVLVKVM